MNRADNANIRVPLRAGNVIERATMRNKNLREGQLDRRSMLSAIRSLLTRCLQLPRKERKE